MGLVDRNEIRACIGEGELAAYAMETAEPLFRALENGFTLARKEDMGLEDVKEAARALGGPSAFLFQTAEDIAGSGNRAFEAAMSEIGFEDVGLTDIESSGVFDACIDDAVSALLYGKLDDRLIDIVGHGIYDILLSYFTAVENGEEERVRAMSPLVALIPKAIPTPFGTKGVLTFLVA